MALLFLAPGINAQDVEGLYYGYSGDEINGISVETPKVYYAAAFRLSEEDTKKYDGCTLNGVSIGFGSGTRKEIQIFLTKDLKGTPFFTQDGRVRPNEWNDIKLTAQTPEQEDALTIKAGEPFYIGYTYYCVSAFSYPIGFDGNTGGYNSEADWIAYSTDENKLMDSWIHNGASSGNVCIRAILTGGNLPTNNCIPTSLTVPDIVYPGNQFTFSINFSNSAVASVNSIEYTYQIGSDPAVTAEKVFDTPVKPNASGSIEIVERTEQDDMALPIRVRINKVNGVDNESDRELVSSLVCTNGLFERQVVLEEYTGVNCGYCPRGIQCIRQMSREEPTGFIAIAIHNYSSDPMRCSAYKPWETSCNFKNAGAPRCTVNRDPELATDPTYSNVRTSFDKVHTMTSRINIDVDFVPSGDKKIDVTGTVSAMDDYNDIDYSMTFVSTEDYVGPYTQYNGYAGGGLGYLEGFSDKSSWVSMKHDHVARNIATWNGIKGSVPTSLSKGDKHSYTLKDFDLSAVNKLANSHVIALLIDNKTGIILDGASVKYDPVNYGAGEYNSVESVEADDALSAIMAGEGYIANNAAEGSAEVYTLSGVHAASIAAGDSAEFTPGIYIVVLSQGAVKVTVK